MTSTSASRCHSALSLPMTLRNRVVVCHERRTDPNADASVHSTTSRVPARRREAGERGFGVHVQIPSEGISTKCHGPAHPPVKSRGGRAVAFAPCNLTRLAVRLASQSFVSRR
jgi:hypothetical protein